MNDLLLWLVLILAGYLFGMVSALTLMSHLRTSAPPVVLAAPPPPPASLEGGGCASTFISLLLVVFVLFLLWFGLGS